MPIKLLEGDKWKAAAKRMADDGLMDEADFLESFGVVKFCAHEVRKPKDAEDELELEFVISDDSVDRMNDVIEQRGMDLTNYKRNPVVLWAHDSSGPPIAQAVRTYREKGEKVDGRALNQTVSIARFMPREMSEFSHMIHSMCAGKFLRACSVGVKVSKYEPAEDEARPYGLNFKASELLEWSVVPIPANPNALARAAEVGIDTAPLVGWAERVLDGSTLEGAARSDVENAWKQLSARAIRVDLARNAQAREETDVNKNKGANEETEETEAEENKGALTAGLVFTIGGQAVALPEGVQVTLAVGKSGEVELVELRSKAKPKDSAEDDDDEEDDDDDHCDDDKDTDADEELSLDDVDMDGLLAAARESVEKAWSAGNTEGTEDDK